MNKSGAILVFLCLIIFFSAGCISNDNEGPKKISYEIFISNFSSNDVYVSVAVDDKHFDDIYIERHIGKISPELADDSSDPDTGIETGKHDINIVVRDNSGKVIFNDTMDIEVYADFDINIKIKQNRLDIKIDEELPEIDHNAPPTIKNGTFEIINETIYRFSVIYNDSDGDAPIDSELWIFSYYHDANGTPRIKIMTYTLLFQTGSYTIGALYSVDLGFYYQGDDFYFAFNDGYEYAIAEADTPITPPL
jgi:hypothetical protein